MKKLTGKATGTGNSGLNEAHGNKVDKIFQQECFLFSSKTVKFDLMTYNTESKQV